jgi:hypothetical protein
MKLVHISFCDLWRAFPQEHLPCKNAQGQAAYGNQCAVRLGLAFQRAGVSLATYAYKRCGVSGHTHEVHPLAAEQLARWLKDLRPSLGKAKILKKPLDKNELRWLRSRSGILLLRNFWQRPGERVAAGDHIDLWMRGEFADGYADWVESAPEVWFWDMGEWLCFPKRK